MEYFALWILKFYSILSWGNIFLSTLNSGKSCLVRFSENFKPSFSHQFNRKKCHLIGISSSSLCGITGKYYICTSAQIIFFFCYLHRKITFPKYFFRTFIHQFFLSFSLCLLKTQLFFYKNSHTIIFYMEWLAGSSFNSIAFIFG